MDGLRKEGRVDEKRGKLLMLEKEVIKRKWKWMREQMGEGK